MDKYDNEIKGITVAQLIEKLKQFPQDAEVLHNGRYYYAPVNSILEKKEFNQIILLNKE